jgi:hemolysin III
MKLRVKDPVSGLTHLAGCLVGLVGVAWLLARGSRDLGTVLTSATYGVCLVVLYAASALYHLVIANEKITRRLRLFDHIAIFLMVAGSCTPVFFRALHGTTRTVMLLIVWSVALAGIAFKLLWRDAPRWLYTVLYVAMGWGIVVQWSKLLLPAGALSLVLAGGITYTLGAVVYAIKRPDPFPKVFGFHEIWHLFVLGGSVLHFAAIARLV